MRYEQYSWNGENKAIVLIESGCHGQRIPVLSRTNVTASRPVLGYGLRLRGIRVHSHVGVSEAERARAQELVVAVDIELNGDAYPTTDEIDRAADYADIVRIADESARERDDRLLETYALRVARRLVERWPAAHRARVAVTKAIVPIEPRTDEATVEVTLGGGLA